MIHTVIILAIAAIGVVMVFVKAYKRTHRHSH